VITAFATVLQAQIQLIFAFDLIPQDKARALYVVKYAKRLRDNSLASLVGKERAALLIEAYEAPALANQG
jgi:hypothetical protein